MSPVVSKAGNLLQSRINELALCIAYPESAQKSGLSLSRAEKKDEKVVDSSVRFSTKESGYPSLEVTDVAFSVNKALMLHGVTVYGSVDASYKYKVVLIQQTDTSEPLAEGEGTFSQSDYYGESFVNLTFKQPAKLEVSCMYILPKTSLHVLKHIRTFTCTCSCILTTIMKLVYMPCTCTCRLRLVYIHVHDMPTRPDCVLFSVLSARSCVHGSHGAEWSSL